MPVPFNLVRHGNLLGLVRHPEFLGGNKMDEVGSQHRLQDLKKPLAYSFNHLLHKPLHPDSDACRPVRNNNRHVPSENGRSAQTFAS